MKRIVLCADDYGQAPEISKAILKLGQMQRISAISCLVTSPYWEEHAAWLTSLHHEIDIGLHLNFTEGRSLSSDFCKRYGAFRGRSILFNRRIYFEPKIVLSECLAQLQAFINVMGRLPDFIDGHHHIHQFPPFNNAVIEMVRSRLEKRVIYVRCVKEKIYFSPPTGLLKKLALNPLGYLFEKKLQAHHIPYNQAFAGIYSFKRFNAYRDYFMRFLTSLPPVGGLVMCHPGLKNQDSDLMSQVRNHEFKYLSSVQFGQDCASKNIEIAPFYMKK